MLLTITPAEMKALENRFMEETRVPGALLMEHAALGVVEAIARYAADGDVVFLCGPGNNGGDGYAAARLWESRGPACHAHIIELTADVRGDALLNRQLAQISGIPIYSEEDYGRASHCRVIVDALFGTGLSRAVDGFAAQLINWVNDRSEYAAPTVIAVDIPSGVDGTTGEVLGVDAIRATETVTFHRPKQGLYLASAPDYTGKITVHPLMNMNDCGFDLEYEGMVILQPEDLRPSLFRRNAVCHKGDFGRVVLFCGSRGMAGAAALCANAAIRTGAGLTTILCRESLLPILQALAPGATCAVLPEKDGVLQPESAAISRDILARADAACIGCGLGLTPDVMPILRLFTEADCPVLWDADALTLFSRTDGVLPLKECDVITPHPGEAARLLDCDVEDVTGDALAALDRLHDLCGCTVLLKGARTLITDGMNVSCSAHTSPALAKGGSGDVLSGIITALLARQYPERDEGRLSSWLAASYGALIHGLAGIRVANLRGENCTLLTELVDYIRLDAKVLG